MWIFQLIIATDFNNHVKGLSILIFFHILRRRIYVEGERFRYVANSVLGTGVYNSDGMPCMIILYADLIACFSGEMWN